MKIKIDIKNVKKESFVFAIDNAVQGVLGLPIDLRPASLAFFAAAYQFNAYAPTLYYYDKDGYMWPSPGRVISLEEQAFYDIRNEYHYEYLVNRNLALDNYLSSVLMGYDPDQFYKISGISGGVNELFLRARGVRTGDPLVLDLDGDGIETVGISNVNPILFDHDADGIKTGTGWIKPDDGLLVLDINGNGVIDSGRELFGDQTMRIEYVTEPNGRPFHANGYAALAVHDSNGDGKISSADGIYTQLRVWQDANQDGVSQANELRTLHDLGIASVGVEGAKDNSNLGGGNTMPLKGTFTRSDGASGASGTAELSGSLLLASNGFYREFPDDPALTEAAKALPQMDGSGWVRDLQEAMSTGGGEALRSKVQAFATATTREAQLALVDGLLLEWANSSGKKLNEVWEYSLSKDAQGAYTTGSQTTTSVGPPIILKLNPDGLTEMVDGGLSGRKEVLTYEGHLFLERLNVLEVFNGIRFIEIPARESDGRPQGSPSAGSGSSGGSGVSDGTVRFTARISESQVDLLNESYAALRESIYGALVMQTRLKPYVEGINLVVDETGLHFDMSQMVAAMDQAKAADARNGTIDLIELNKYAQSTFQALGFDGLGRLRLDLGNVPASDLKDLNVFVNGDKGTPGADLFLGSGAGASFSGGAGDDVLDGGIGNDNIIGHDGNDILNGREGNDNLQGQEGNDSLLGGAGADYLYGGAGNDTLDGGAGNDALQGDAGNDTYLFGRGDGVDTISYDTESVAGKHNVLRFKAGVNAADVTVTREGGYLVLAINGTSDKVWVSHFFNENTPTNSWNPVQEVVFANGTSWGMEALAAMTRVGTSGADNLIGSNGADSLDGLGGNDTLSGGLGNDTLNGGEGDDNLQGQEGNDSLLGGAGADYLYGGAGNDTLDGGAGNDALQGDAGNDTYLFGRGDGVDTISYDTESVAGKHNVLRFKAGVNAADVTVTREGGYLVLAINGTSDKVWISHFFNENTPTNSWNPIQEVVFEDGTSWSMAALAAKTAGGTPGADNLIGTNGPDSLDGLGGNDTLSGGLGDDTLNGGEGDDNLQGQDGNDSLLGGAGADYLYGGAGNDTLDGGAGNDALQGDAGNDTYLFGRGDGVDTISYDTESVAGKHNVLRFKAGVNAADVTVTREGGYLVLAINGTSDKVWVSHFFNENTPTNSWNPIQEVVFEDGTSWSMAALAAKTAGGTPGADNLIGTNGPDSLDGLGGNDTLSGGLGDDTLNGGEGDDNLQGQDGNDSLLGGAGADYLYGGAGNDTLDGGAGNDALQGDAGNDTYLFGRGDGVDTISYDTESVAGKHNVLRFKAGVNAADVTVTREGGYLVLAINGTSDKVWISHFFNENTPTNSWNPIQEVVFEDGTSWSMAALAAKTAGGTPGADNLIGTNGPDSLDGLGGNDTLSGGLGDDTLNGGEGDDNLQGQDGNDSLLGGAGADYLYGGAGNDTLDGGAGNDALQGDAGNDTYLFGRGDGVDTISYDTESVAGKHNVLRFKAGVNAADVTVTREGGYLVLAINGTSDKVWISHFFNENTPTNSWNPIQEVVFEDGTSWSMAALAAKTAGGTPGADNLIGTNGPDSLDGLGGNDTLSGGLGDDTLNGGEGDDNLQGQDGNDSLLGGAGADYLYGGAGNDTLDGGAGNDALQGDAGNDTYLFGRGDGVDTISYDTESVAGKHNVLRFKAGVNAADVTVTREGGYLVLAINGTSDKVWISHFFNENTPTNSWNPIQEVVFEDGTSWSMAALAAKTAGGTPGADNLIGTNGPDSLDGLGGNDTLSGGLGDDTLNGGEGDDNLQGQDGNDSLLGGAGADYLYGGAGNDTLDGGAGNDALQGDAGNDTYLFGRGDGVDTISYDTESVAGKHNVLRFKAGVNAADVTVTREGGYLVLAINGTSDKVWISHFFNENTPTNSWNPVQEVVFEGGTSWSMTDLVAKTQGSNAQAGSGSGSSAQSRALVFDGFDTQAAIQTATLNNQAQQLADAMAGFAPPAGAQTSGSVGAYSPLGGPVLAANALA